MMCNDSKHGSRDWHTGPLIRGLMCSAGGCRFDPLAAVFLIQTHRNCVCVPSVLHQTATHVTVRTVVQSL